MATLLVTRGANPQDGSVERSVDNDAELDGIQGANPIDNRIPSAPHDLAQLVNLRQKYDVIVRRSKRDILRTWTLTSTLNLVADGDVTFEDRYWRKFDEFRRMVTSEGLFGEAKERNIALTLVSLTLPNQTSPSPPYICIKGLRAHKEITEINALLSRKSTRERYKPLHICFDKSQIVAAAAEGFTVDFDKTHAHQTLCGTLVRSESGGQISTIGGILEVNGVLCAVTTLHPAQIEKGWSALEAGNTALNESSHALLDSDVDEGSFDNDIGPALIVDDWKRSQDVQNLPLPRRASGILNQSYKSWPKIGDSILACGSDWCLIPIENEVCRLPNLVPGLLREGGASELENGSSSDNDPNLTYIAMFDRAQHRRIVHVITGRSGICVGVISQNPSYLKIGSDAWATVLTIYFKASASGLALQKGDSGSWVVDATAWSLIGYVIAVSDDMAYVIPIQHLLDEIQTVIPNCTLQLPSPFTLLANLARYYSRKGKSLDDILAWKYAASAASPPVLRTSITMSNPGPNKSLCALLFRTLKIDKERQMLPSLLQTTGADLEPILAARSSNIGNISITYDPKLSDFVRELSNAWHAMQESPESGHLRTVSNDLRDEIATSANEKPSAVEHTETSNANEEPTKQEDGDQISTSKDMEAAEDDQDNESKYLTGFPLIILTIGLCLTTFVIALDNTIIATAIPRITTAFNSLGDVGWYGSSYLLATCSLQPSFGKVYTYFNVKWTYLFALTLFEVGSVICAAAIDSLMFIVGRAITGAGAAALFSGGITIISYSVALRKRPIYIAVLSSMFGIASIVGPILGGALIDKVSWRWCFWINLPFGGISLAIVFFFFTNPERQYSYMSVKDRIKEIDLLSVLFLICSIICLLLALQWGGTTYPWHNSKIWGCLLGFGLLIIIFIGLQVHQGDQAILPPKILGQRTILASSLFTLFFSIALYTHIFYLPFYFQVCKGTTAEGSGIRTIAYLVSITLSSVVISGIITAIGYYTPFMWFSSAVFCVGAGMLYTLKVNSGASKWLGYQILAGVGAGAGVQIPFIAVQVVLSNKDIPTGNAVVSFFNSLGGAIAISIAQNIFVNSLSRDIPKLAPGVDPKIVIGAGATHFRDVVPTQWLPGVLQAYTNAITSAFILAIAAGGIAFFVSWAMEWKSVNGKKLLPGGGT